MDIIEFQAWLYVWSDIFKNESERGSVVLGTTAIDLYLSKFTIQVSFVDSYTQKTGDFIKRFHLIQKIEFAYQLGLISKHLRDDLNLIRIIRNEFVHPNEMSVFRECSLENNPVKNWAESLFGHFKIFLEQLSYLKYENFAEGNLGNFQKIIAWITYYLVQGHNIRHKETKIESIYSNDIK